jgi:hypothetical protein
MITPDFAFLWRKSIRYLNSQVKDFKYNIHNLQELTESFSNMTPNYMSSIDLTSGFFQMGFGKFLKVVNIVLKIFNL